MDTSAKKCNVPFVQRDGSDGALRDTGARGTTGASKAILAILLASADERCAVRR